MRMLGLVWILLVLGLALGDVWGVVVSCLGMFFTMCGVWWCRVEVCFALCLW